MDSTIPVLITDGHVRYSVYFDGITTDIRSGAMTTTADLKIQRASKHIDELNKLLREKRPFTYVLETNTKTGERATFAKKNEPVLREAEVICGDAIHNLRAALDHAYWEIVSPFAVSDKERSNIQFPFCKTQARLSEAVKNRLAHKVSTAFLDAIVGLNPYGESGGNELLYLVDHLDVIDKHKLLIPTGDYKQISGFFLKRQVPDFPFVNIWSVGLGQNARDFSWKVNLTGIPAGAPEKLEQELNVPVDIVFAVGSGADGRAMVPTLYQFVQVIKRTIAIMRSASQGNPPTP